MILLRNLLLAVAGCVVAGFGFHAFLTFWKPPEQWQASAAADAASTHVENDPFAKTLNDLVDTATSAFAERDAPAPEIPAASATGVTTPPVAAVVPAWLAKRLRDEAQRQGSILAGEDEQALAQALMSMRDLGRQTLAENAGVAGAGGNAGEGWLASLEGASRWQLTARAVQVELLFRQHLGIGLAEFMKTLTAQEIDQLLRADEKARLRGISHQL